MEAVLTMPKERLLTIKEAAEILRVSTRTVRRRIQDRLLRAIETPGRGKTGIEYRIPDSAIDEYLQGGHKEQGEGD